MRRLALALILSVFVAPVTVVAVSVPAQAQAKVNNSMSKALPDEPDGWKMSEVRPATGVLPMYSAATAEATYTRGPVKVVVGAARTPSLFKAIDGSIRDVRSLPPNAKVEVIHGKRAVVTRYPDAEVPLYQAQILAGVDGIIILTTRSGTVEHLIELAKDLDFSQFPGR